MAKTFCSSISGAKKSASKSSTYSLEIFLKSVFRLDLEEFSVKIEENFENPLF